MKRLLTVFVLAVLACLPSHAQEDVLNPSTLGKRVIRASTAAAARTELGIVGTNVTLIATPDNSTLKTNSSGIVAVQSDALAFSMVQSNSVLTVSNQVASVDLTRVVGVGDLAGLKLNPERLFAVRMKMMNHQAITVGLYGDSTFVGDAVTNTAFLPQNILSSVLSRRYASGVTVANHAVSGSTLRNWETNGGLASFIASPPDVAIFGFGFNHDSTNATDLEADYNRVFSTMQSSNVTIETCSRLVLSIQSGSDDANDRGLRWGLSVNVPLRRVASANGAAFLDAFALARDAYKNLTNHFDHPYGDYRGVHGKEMIKLCIWPEVADCILSEAQSVVINSLPWTGYTNPPSTSWKPTVAVLPAVFSNGLSLTRADPATGFTNDGSTFTFKHVDGVEWQVNNAYTGTGLRWRNGGPAAWLAWRLPLQISDAGLVDWAGSVSFPGLVESKTRYIATANGSDSAGGGSGIQLQSANGLLSGMLQLNSAGSMDVWTLNGGSWARTFQFGTNAVFKSGGLTISSNSGPATPVNGVVLWFSNNVTLFARWTNGVDKPLVSFP